MKYVYIIGVVIFIIGILLVIISIIKDKLKKFNLVSHSNSKYAIIIPARNESKVIEKLLKSIELQNKDMSNVYVIVEDNQDLTCEIVKRYNSNIYVRQKPLRPRKGYALDECIKDILKKEHYDLYFIFDADNILDKNYIKNMLKYWNKGYEVCIGYRSILNPKSTISCCSGILFSILNSIINKIRIRNNRSIILSGTGFYVSGKIIEELNGFPFYSLTEDYELSLYLASNNIPCSYNDKAIFYDEQPTTLKTSIKQRIRWLGGFFEARHNKLNTVKDNLSIKLGLLPYLFIIFSLIGLFLCGIINLLITRNLNNLFIILITIIILYFSLFIITLYILITEKNKINIPKEKKIKCLFASPLFLFTYVYCLFKCIFSKEITWDVIEHKGNSIIKD